jgi:hypothetical protein
MVYGLRTKCGVYPFVTRTPTVQIRIKIKTVLYLHHIVTNLSSVDMEEETRMLTPQLPYKGSFGPGSYISSKEQLIADLRDHSNLISSLQMP